MMSLIGAIRRNDVEQVDKYVNLLLDEEEEIPFEALEVAVRANNRVNNNATISIISIIFNGLIRASRISNDTAPVSKALRRIEKNDIDLYDIVTEESLLNIINAKIKLVSKLLGHVDDKFITTQFLLDVIETAEFRRIECGSDDESETDVAEYACEIFNRIYDNGYRGFVENLTEECLLRAIKAGSYNLVSFIVDKGDPKIITKKCILKAIARTEVLIVEALWEGISDDSYEMITPILIEMLEDYRRNWRSFISDSDSDGDSDSDSDNKDKKLLRDKANEICCMLINLTSSEEITNECIIKAIETSNSKIVQALLSHSGLLMRAIKEDSANIVCVLLKSGACITLKSVTAVMKRGDADTINAFFENASMDFKAWKKIIQFADRETLQALLNNPTDAIKEALGYQNRRYINQLELKKNSRTIYVLSQNPSSLFSQLPPELNVMIATMTNSDLHSERRADEIVRNNFGVL